MAKFIANLTIVKEVPGRKPETFQFPSKEVEADNSIQAGTAAYTYEEIAEAAKAAFGLEFRDAQHMHIFFYGTDALAEEGCDDYKLEGTAEPV